MTNQALILDISEWQEPSKLDYQTLARQLAGVIIRVQYGQAHSDKYYQTHIREFQRYNVPVAVYAWVRGKTTEEMVREAQLFYERVHHFQPCFWWLDVEEHSMKDMRHGCEIYRQTLKKLGAKKIGVYVANHLYSTFHLDTKQFDGIWLPAYGQNNGQYEGVNPTATSDYHLHQYTSEGRLKGYDGPLDLSRLAAGKLTDFFSKQQGNQVVTSNGLTFELGTSIYLRTAPKTTAAVISLLQPGSIVHIHRLIPGQGYLWGEQLRVDDKKGYLALGYFDSFGNF